MIIIWGLLQGLGKGQGLIILISFCRHFFNSHSHWSPSFQCKWRITPLLRNDLRVTIFHWTMLGGRDLGVCISWVQNHQAILLIIYVLQATLCIHICPEGSVYACKLDLNTTHYNVIVTHLVTKLFGTSQRSEDPKTTALIDDLIKWNRVSFWPNQWPPTKTPKRWFLGSRGKNHQTSLYMKFTLIFFWGELAPRKNGRTISTWTT